jgi:hypothetical protein
MTLPRLRSICAWLAFAAVVLGWMAGDTGNFRTRILPGNLASPLLAMELLGSQQNVSAIVGAPDEAYNNRAGMVRLIRLDFGFIPAYGLLLVLAGVLTFREGGRRKWAGTALVSLGIAAPVFDVLENLSILRILQGAGAAPRTVSLVKWALVFLAMAAIGFAFLAPKLPALRRTIGFLAAGLSWLAAAFGLAGVTLHKDPLIETAAGLIAASLFVGWLFFATHKTLSQGLLPALDRLAAWRPLSKLTHWPSDDS